MIKLFLIIQLNLVMIRENGQMVSIPTDLAYTETFLSLHTPDTVFGYNILQTTHHKRDTILKLSGSDYTGFVRIDSNSVYIYVYQYRKRYELFLIKDVELYRKLKRNGKK